MQQRRRQHEAQAVAQRRGAQRHFSPMGEAMEQGETADHGHTENQRQVLGEGGGKADDDDRQADHQFNADEAHTRDPGNAAHRHHGDEAGRDGVKCPPAHGRGQQADGDHGQKMVQPADRVHEAVGEARRRADARMGLGDARNDRQGNQQCDETHGTVLSGPSAPVWRPARVRGRGWLWSAAGLLAPDAP